MVRYSMGDAAVQLAAYLCNGTDPRRYSVQYDGIADCQRGETWLVRKAPGPQGSAGALYRVYLPAYSPRVLPMDLVGVATCDCPEARSGGQRLGGLCKHMLMAYCWQGVFHGTGARWFYADWYLFRQRCFRNEQNEKEVHNG